MEELSENFLNKVKNQIDSLPLWQQDVLTRLVTEAMEASYKKGREDQRYYSEGPRTINVY